MGQPFKKVASQTSLGASMGSSTDLRLKCRSKESLASFNSRLSLNGVNRELSLVSWKALHKQSPWLKLLKPHQKRGVEAIVSTDGFAALFAQRTGKTWVTGAVLEVERLSTLDVLLVGPKTNLKSTWVKFFQEKLPHYRVCLSLKEYDAYRKSVGKHSIPNTHAVLMLNPEQVTPIRDKLKRRKWDRMVWDEAQRLKNRTSQSSRDAAMISRAAKRRLALTGTPMDLDPKDLWAIMRFVEVNALGDGWGDFEDHFLVKPTIDLKKKMGMVQRQKMMLAYQIAKRKAPMREDRMEEYADLISPHVMRISKEDAGIDPARVHLIKFDLDPAEEKKYRQLEKHMLVRVKGKAIKTPLKITQIGKLQQITGGHIKDEEGEVHRIGTTKRRRLRRAIRKHVEPGKPFVVFCRFVWEVHLIARILERMNLGRGAKLWGKVKDLKKDPRRTNMLLDFQKGKYDWMVCQQKTGGVGVDLYRARKFFVYSMGHSYIDYDQMLSRGDFLEQNETADFFLLVVRSSIDTDIVSAVVKKKSITEAFYDRLKRKP
jgi:superfamily II DNA or RNA helicase